jgi:hypothetical protein
MEVMIAERIMSSGFDRNSVQKVISVEAPRTSRGKSSPKKWELGGRGDVQDR